MKSPERIGLGRTVQFSLMLSVVFVVSLINERRVLAAGEDTCGNPPGPCEGCDCPDEGDSGDGSEGSESTGFPINFMLHSVIEHATDLSLPGTTVNWSHTRNYDSRVDRYDSFTEQEGKRWNGSATGPYLADGITSPDIELYYSASGKLLFEESSGSYASADNTPHTLVKSNGGTASEVFTLTNTETGNISIFYGLHSSVTTSLHGRLKERTTRDLVAASASGITYNYTSFGAVDWVLNSQGWRIDYEYYTSGNDDERLKSISVYDDPNVSGNLLQHAEYIYFDSTADVLDPNDSPSTDLGLTGDLVQVKVRRRASDDTGNDPEDLSIVRTTQYRYYKDYGNYHQLKLVFESDAIQRILDYSSSDSLVDPEDLLTMLDTDDVGSGGDLQDFASRGFTHYVNGAIPTQTAWGTESGGMCQQV